MRLWCCLCLSGLWVSCLSQASTVAEGVFASLSESTYQIRLIERGSGEKSGIGSGFLLRADGLVATNYHVIAGIARAPLKYRLEYVSQSGEVGALTLLRVDIVNDLALLQRSPVDTPAFVLGDTLPNKGETLYSLGNPSDLGLIVVPGVYNGIKQGDVSEKIHFTGAVNAGMSGGPVVNEAHEVVGVNVAKAGDHIAFLVPVSKLNDLVDVQRTREMIPVQNQIHQQLQHAQAQLIANVLAAPWVMQPLGDALIPMVDVDFIRCWGDSNQEKPNTPLFISYTECRQQDDIYLSPTFMTGYLEMSFEYVAANTIDALRFSRLYQQRLGARGPGNAVTGGDVTNFTCRDELLPSSSPGIGKARTVFCTRAYKKYSGLFDVFFLSASLSHEDKALISDFSLIGVDMDSAAAFTQRVMETVKWK
jgi:serine protease Do